jgi:hypothetical protein
VREAAIFVLRRVARCEDCEAGAPAAAGSAAGAAVGEVARFRPFMSLASQPKSSCANKQVSASTHMEQMKAECTGVMLRRRSLENARTDLFSAPRISGRTILIDPLV